MVMVKGEDVMVEERFRFAVVEECGRIVEVEEFSMSAEELARALKFMRAEPVQFPFGLEGYRIEGESGPMLVRVVGAAAE
jgi:hypothetical protein